MNEYDQIIYKLYPKDIYPSDIAYTSTPEITRQWKLIHRETEDDNDFTRFCRYVQKHYNFSDFQNFSLLGIFDLSRKALFKLPQNPYHIEYPYLVICISVISNFYSVYFTKFNGSQVNTLEKPLSDAQQMIIDSIGRTINSHFTGYILFPMTEYHSEVPHILSSHNAGEFATYYDCLISTHLL